MKVWRAGSPSASAISAACSTASGMSVRRGVLIGSASMVKRVFHGWQSVGDRFVFDWHRVRRGGSVAVEEKPYFRIVWPLPAQSGQGGSDADDRLVDAAGGQDVLDDHDGGADHARAVAQLAGGDRQVLGGERE